MKYLLLFFITFNLQAETWVVEIYNELRQADCACSSEAIAGNGCNKFKSEAEVNKFIQNNIKVWGEKERWVHEKDMRDELVDRVIDERVINPKSFTEKVKSLIGIRSDIVPEESYTEYLIKSDYTINKKDITKEIEKIEEDNLKEKTEKEDVKKIDIDNMTNEEMKRILKVLLKGVR